MARYTVVADPVKGIDSSARGVWEDSEELSVEEPVEEVRESTTLEKVQEVLRPRRRVSRRKKR